jgi:3-dehydroquinate synthase
VLQWRHRHIHSQKAIQMAQQIVIIGPTGAGKTTTGQELARLLGWRALDLDAAITEAESRSAADIFAAEGEDAWRERETDALRGALTRDRVVVALGAGAIERAENRLLMTRSESSMGAWTIALQVSPEVALARIEAQAAEAGLTAAQSRPMLNGEDPLERLRALHERRAPLYAQADDMVDASGSVAQTAARALAGYIFSPHALGADTVTSGNAVMTNAGSYDVAVGWGVLAILPQRLKQLKLPPRLSLVTDNNVGAIYAEPLARALRKQGFEPEVFTIPAGESSKSREVLAEIHDWLAERRIERGEALLALGGGVVGDLAGFAAATWLRGIPFIQLPTSLLAQVDASIGGKVAIDHPRGKNLIGAFYQPRLVIADTATLVTLPARQRVEGWSEVIKHGAALDAEYFELLEREVEKLLAVELHTTAKVVALSEVIKSEIVSADERESEGGRRALLNFGHTLGHAIEAVTGYGAWLHGEVVSAGMVFAARLGVRLGLTPPDVAARLEILLARFGLPTRLDGLSGDSLLQAALWDKKARGGLVRWVLLTNLGRAELSGAVAEPTLRATLAELGAEE